ncbi:MAG: hypothetical protein IPL28_27780 [Chloroflexi bacterium]|nr:hypothetical protein [Chloroflexota bacterium]
MRAFPARTITYPDLPPSDFPVPDATRPRLGGGDTYSSWLPFSNPAVVCRGWRYTCNGYGNRCLLLPAACACHLPPLMSGLAAVSVSCAAPDLLTFGS